MKRSLSILTLAVLSLTAWQTAVACTGIRLIAKDGSVVVARTLEFGADLESKVGVYPAGTTFVGTLPNNGTGITFKSKYGMVGANAFGLPVIVDGLNDHGLYVGEFFFPGSAQLPTSLRRTRRGPWPDISTRLDARELRDRRRSQGRLRSRRPRADRLAGSWGWRRRSIFASWIRPARPSSSSRSAAGS